MKIAIIDNNDSFTYNLVQLVAEANLAEISVINHKDVILDDLEHFNKIIFSPGPSLPDDFPIMKKILEKYQSSKSILGVCMGMQAIAEFYGARLYNLDNPIHGQRQSLHIINETSIFKNIKQSSTIGLYHSWAVKKESIPTNLEILATNEHETLMALQHKAYNIIGVQFHPESIITEEGSQMIKNWIEM